MYIVSGVTENTIDPYILIAFMYVLQNGEDYVSFHGILEEELLIELTKVERLQEMFFSLSGDS